MTDLIYVLSTLAFFALMIAYVRACDRLGHAAAEPGHDTPGSQDHRS